VTFPPVSGHTDGISNYLTEFYERLNTYVVQRSVPSILLQYLVYGTDLPLDFHVISTSTVFPLCDVIIQILATLFIFRHWPISWPTRSSGQFSCLNSSKKKWKFVPLEQPSPLRPRWCSVAVTATWQINLEPSTTVN